MVKRKRLTIEEKNQIGTFCVSCGAIDDLVYHHILPLSFGGKDVLSNICCLCNNCHYKLHHCGKEKKYNQTYSDLIKEGIKNSSKKSGRKPGSLDKLTFELKNDILEYLTNNPDLTIFKNCNELLEKHNISRNTFKKYCRLMKEESASDGPQ